MEILKDCKSLNDVSRKLYGKANYTNREKVKLYLKENGVDWKDWLETIKLNNTKYCIVCGKKLEKDQKLFCSHSCSASYNNKKRVRKQKHERVCLNCGGEITDLRKSTKFCGSHCQREYEYKQYILRWKSGECSGNRGVGQLSQFVRRYMLEKTNCSCEICGCNWVNPKSGRPIVEIHHIDGDANNSKEENLQVLCPNHHAMTVNYSALNTGKSTRTKRKTNSEGNASPNKLEK